MRAVLLCVLFSVLLATASSQPSNTTNTTATPTPTTPTATPTPPHNSSSTAATNASSTPTPAPTRSPTPPPTPSPTAATATPTASPTPPPTPSPPTPAPTSRCSRAHQDDLSTRYWTFYQSHSGVCEALRFLPPQLTAPPPPAPFSLSGSEKARLCDARVQQCLAAFLLLKHDIPRVCYDFAMRTTTATSALTFSIDLAASIMAHRRDFCGVAEPCTGDYLRATSALFSALAPMHKQCAELDVFASRAGLEFSESTQKWSVKEYVEYTGSYTPGQFSVLEVEQICRTQVGECLDAVYALYPDISIPSCTKLTVTLGNVPMNIQQYMALHRVRIPTCADIVPGACVIEELQNIESLLGSLRGVCTDALPLFTPALASAQASMLDRGLLCSKSAKICSSAFTALARSLTDECSSAKLDVKGFPLDYGAMKQLYAMQQRECTAEGAVLLCSAGETAAITDVLRDVSLSCTHLYALSTYKLGAALDLEATAAVCNPAAYACIDRLAALAGGAVSYECATARTSVAVGVSLPLLSYPLFSAMRTSCVCTSSDFKTVFTTAEVCEALSSSLTAPSSSDNTTVGTAFNVSHVSANHTQLLCNATNATTACLSQVALALEEVSPLCLEGLFMKVVAGATELIDAYNYAVPCNDALYRPTEEEDADTDLDVTDNTASPTNQTSFALILARPSWLLWLLLSLLAAHV